MSYFQDVALTDLYKGMGLEHNLILNFLIESTEQYHQPSDISQLYGAAIESGLQISRREVGRIVKELDDCGAVYRWSCCETVAARPEGMLYLRRN